MNERTIIGSRIAIARRAAHLNQNELGRAIGVSGQTISNWENARYVPSATDIVSLVHVLGCSASFLLGLSDTLSITVKRP